MRRDLDALLACAAVMAFVLAGCCLPPSPSQPAPSPSEQTPSPSATPNFYPVFSLPTVDWQSDVCAGVGLADVVLTGDPGDPRVAWLVPAQRRDAVRRYGDAASIYGAGRLIVLFPQGFTARFAPDLQIMDTTGKVVAGEGDHIRGACVTGSDRPLLILLGS